MRRILLLPVVLAAGLSVVSCSDSSSGGGVLAGVVATSLGTAVRADLSGQEDVFVGTLGSGVTFTFPVVKDQTYLITIQTANSADEVTFDVIGDDGAALRSKSQKSGETFGYQHLGASQHVIVLCRPRNPFDTAYQVTSLKVTGVGAFSKTQVRVNFYVTGEFTGYGAYNDLVDASSQASFTNAVMGQVQQLFLQTGIAISYEGFAYSADQVRALQPALVDANDQTVCSAGESVSSTGFEVVSEQGLDQWGQLGFPETDPDFDRAHGIDVYLVHHFTQDGTVGLSPRPGLIAGNGDDTALCAAAFLQQGGTYTARTVDEIALVTAHEIGHFLGLLHTTTFSPSPLNPNEAVDDGIDDTPRCTVITDVNGDGRVGLGDGCQDEANIMFYQAGGQTQFSAKQAVVMQNLLSVQEH